METRAMPEVGQGATVMMNGSECPATIVRVAFDGLVVWMQVDRVEEGDDGQARFVHDPTEWVLRAVRKDGEYRLDPDMQRVEIGRRRYRRTTGPWAMGFESFRERVERIEPCLLRRRWYPMTYMGIPSLLRSADDLLAEMDAYRGADEAAVRVLRERLAVRRDGFKRAPRDGLA